MKRAIKRFIKSTGSTIRSHLTNISTGSSSRFRDNPLPALLECPVCSDQVSELLSWGDLPPFCEACCISHLDLDPAASLQHPTVAPDAALDTGRDTLAAADVELHECPYPNCPVFLASEKPSEGSQGLGRLARCAGCNGEVCSVCCMAWSHPTVPGLKHSGRTCSEVRMRLRRQHDHEAATAAAAAAARSLETEFMDATAAAEGFEAEVPSELCCTCYTNHGQISCSSKDCRHWFCSECFKNAVQHQITNDIKSNNGEIHCPMGKNCNSLPYEFFALAQILSKDIFTQLDEARVGLRLVEAEKEVANRHGDEDVVARHCRHIVDQVLTLARPCCGLAYFDHEGCAAVTCTCKKHFCGLCFLECSDNKKCHDHVRRDCRFSTGSLFMDDKWYKQSHGTLFSEKLIEYFQRVKDEDGVECARRVLSQSQPNFVDMEINIGRLQDIVN